MATSPETHQSFHRRTGSPTVQDSQQLSDDLNSEDRAADSQYREIKSTQRVPIKSGEEEDMHADENRPGSAGSNHSTKLPDEEEEFLRTVSVSKKEENEPTQLSAMQGPFLSRGSSHASKDSPAAFSFGHHHKPQIDLQGTRTFGAAPSTASQSQHQSDHTEGCDAGQSLMSPCCSVLS